MPPPAGDHVRAAAIRDCATALERMAAEHADPVDEYAPALLLRAADRLRALDAPYVESHARPAPEVDEILDELDAGRAERILERLKRHPTWSVEHGLRDVREAGL